MKEQAAGQTHVICEASMIGSERNRMDLGGVGRAGSSFTLVVKFCSTHVIFFSENKDLARGETTRRHEITRRQFLSPQLIDCTMIPPSEATSTAILAFQKAIPMS